MWESPGQKGPEEVGARSHTPKATGHVPLASRGLGLGMQFGEVKGNQAWALKRVPPPAPPPPELPKMLRFTPS